MVSASGITYDNQGKAVGGASLSIQPWIDEPENGYRFGSVVQVKSPPVQYAAPPYWGFAGANQSGNKASILCHDDRDKLVAEYGKYKAGFTPVCFASEFVPSSNSTSAQGFAYSVLNQDDIAQNDYPDWAILKSLMLRGLENIHANSLRRGLVAIEPILAHKEIAYA